VCCNVLQCGAVIMGKAVDEDTLTLCCKVLQFVAVRCCALLCVAVRCCVLQCVAVDCSAL